MRNKLKIILTITIVYFYINDLLKIQIDIKYTIKPPYLLISNWISEEIVRYLGEYTSYTNKKSK